MGLKLARIQIFHSKVGFSSQLSFEKQLSACGLNRLVEI